MRCVTRGTASDNFRELIPQLSNAIKYEMFSNQLPTVCVVLLYSEEEFRRGGGTQTATIMSPSLPRA